jgi:hypothetical protein
MSESMSHSVSSAPKAEADHFSLRLVVGVGMAALVISALATWVSHEISVGEVKMVRPSGEMALPSEVGKAEIGIVNQKLFEQQLGAQRKQAQQQQALSSYGWVDRNRGIIRIPIEQAMTKLVSEPEQ